MPEIKAVSKFDKIEENVIDRLAGPGIGGRPERRIIFGAHLDDHRQFRVGHFGPAGNCDLGFRRNCRQPGMA